MSRHYCVTFWKEPELIDDSKVRYAIHGKEIAPTTGTVHWQSYIEFYKPQTVTALKKMYNDKTLHAGVRNKGTREQARDYCKKDGNWIQHGCWIKGQGHRTDLDKIVNKMKAGTKLNEIILTETETYCRFRNGLKDVNAELVKNRTKEFRKLEVVLITGPTGCGKTRSAVESSTDYYKIEGSNLDWFQDYNEEKTLIIDEYNNDIAITKLLGLLDGYQLRLNVKGSHTYAAWDKVFITTNLKIDELHANAKEEHRNALFRRITSIINHYRDNEVVNG